MTPAELRDRIAIACAVVGECDDAAPDTVALAALAGLVIDHVAAQAAWDVCRAHEVSSARARLDRTSAALKAAIGRVTIAQVREGLRGLGAQLRLEPEPEWQQKVLAKVHRPGTWRTLVNLWSRLRHGWRP